MAYGKCVSYYHSGLLESLTHRLSELGVVWNAVESHPLLQHIRNQGAKKVSNSPLRTRRSGRAAHWAAGLDWRPGLLVGSSVLSYLPRDFPLRHRGGVIASTPPALLGGPQGNADRQAWTVGVCLCWWETAQGSGLGERVQRGRLGAESRDTAQGGGRGRNVHCRDRGRIDSNHPQAGQLHGRVCSHTGPRVWFNALLLPPSNSYQVFKQGTPHFYFAQAPINCVASFAHGTESRARA